MTDNYTHCTKSENASKIIIPLLEPEQLGEVHYSSWKVKNVSWQAQMKWKQEKGQEPRPNSKIKAHLLNEYAENCKQFVFSAGEAQKFCEKVIHHNSNLQSISLS